MLNRLIHDIAGPERIGRMVKEDGFMMVQTAMEASPEPLIDSYTMTVAGVWRKATETGVRFRGFHTCYCGATSDNAEWVLELPGIGKALTNSLAVHYAAHHREAALQATTPETLRFIAQALGAEPVEPTERELVSPNAPSAPKSEPPAAPEPRRIALPASYYVGAHGDPIAQFDHLALVLHPDGRVTWERVD